MLLSELTAFLNGADHLSIQLPDGTLVPPHFHVTEVGEVTRHFIDCGGKRRHERVANLQLWNADDYDHRLAPGKLRSILELAIRDLDLGDLEIEVEYQGTETMQKFGLAATADRLLLTSKVTDCLAKDKCGIPAPKQQISLGQFVAKPASNCTPGSGCC